MVKRGPGGYYGVRPDSAALERAFATYLRVHDIGYRETFEMIVALDRDIAEAAADCEDGMLRESVTHLMENLARCETAEECIQFEVDATVSAPCTGARFQAMARPRTDVVVACR